jgi:hypothetical protein
MAGYRLCITRGGGPNDRGERPITADEWSALVERHGDMQRDRNASRGDPRDGNAAHYAVAWTGSKYRESHPAHEEIHYWFREGIVNAPAMAEEDNEHLIAVARELGARVFGEEGEEYGIPWASRTFLQELAKTLCSPTASADESAGALAGMRVIEPVRAGAMAACIFEEIERSTPWCASDAPEVEDALVALGQPAFLVLEEYADALAQRTSIPADGIGPAYPARRALDRLGLGPKPKRPRTRHR